MSDVESVSSELEGPSRSKRSQAKKKQWYAIIAIVAALVPDVCLWLSYDRPIFWISILQWAHRGSTVELEVFFSYDYL